MKINKRLLIFHRAIAPYRIDFFNWLSENFCTRICLQYRNLLSQHFDYDKIESQFVFKPVYLKILFRLKGRVINTGYWKHLKEFDPEIVLVGEFGLECILVLLYRFFYRKKYKVISICDDSHDMVLGNDFSRWHRWSRKCIVPFLDNLFLVDSRVQKWYQEKYGKGLWMPIISDEQRLRKTYERLLPLSNTLNKSYNLEGKKIILYVGRLVKIKNVSCLINAYAPLKEKARLVIIGDGECRSELELQNDMMETDILFLGRKEGAELFAWYNIADVFVLPSVQEAFGAVTNEALLGGCFSVISNKAGSACLINEGINGNTFDPFSVEMLQTKLKEWLDSISFKDAIVLKENLMQMSFQDFFNDVLSRI